jgi:hypothetical protein
MNESSKSEEKLIKPEAVSKKPEAISKKPDRIKKYLYIVAPVVAIFISFLIVVSFFSH